MASVIRKRSNVLWVLIGFGVSLAGAAVAGWATALSLADSTDDLAGFLYIVTIPAGYLVGLLIATIAGVLATRRLLRRGVEGARFGSYAFAGALIPSALVVVGQILGVLLL